jgi:hypothetical protein
MTETELKNTVQKAHRAEQLLNDPLIQEFIISLRGDLLHKFESTELEDTETRKDAWQQGQVLKLFLAKFTKQIKAGKSAQLSLMDKINNNIRKII